MATGTAGQPHPNGQKSHLLPLLLLPGTLTRLQMRSLHSVGPQEEACKEPHFPLRRNANTQRQRKGNSKAPSSTELGSEAEKDSGLRPPGQAQLSSASLGRGLGESGASFTEEVASSHGSPGHRISMLPFCWHWGCLTLDTYEVPLLWALPVQHHREQPDWQAHANSTQLLPPSPVGKKPESRGVRSQDFGSLRLINGTTKVTTAGTSKGMACARHQ